MDTKSPSQLGATGSLSARVLAGKPPVAPEPNGPAGTGSNLRMAVAALCVLSLVLAAGCARKTASVAEVPGPRAATRPAPVYDTTAARPIVPRDWLERLALKRGPDFKLVDRLMDGRTRPPAFDRRPLPRPPADARIADGVPTLDDSNPFPEPLPLPPKAATVVVGTALSTYRTRTRQEVLSAIVPLLDNIQREVNVRSSVVLLEQPREIYFGLIDGKQQMIIGHIFEYFLVRSWFAGQKDSGVIPLAWAYPAYARTMEGNLPGVPGTSILLVVAGDAPYRRFSDLKGTRLALTVNYVHAPGAFLTRQLADIGHATDQPFFSKVTLRRYPKDAVIDVIKGKADVACVDEGTVEALDRFYGIGDNGIRTLAVSPRYNLDTLYTSQNNVATHRTEIELTQRQIETLGKDAEGQEVLFFFDTRSWSAYHEGDYSVPEQYFGDFVKFLSETPVDLKPLLDPKAPVDTHTYDRYGDD